MNINKISLAIVVGGVLIVGAFIYNNWFQLGALSSKEASEKAITFINQNIEEGAVASLVGVTKEGDVYKIILKINEIQYESYITQDGKFLFPTGISLEALNSQETPAQETTTTASAAFAQCLTSKNMKFYGSKNCGWCAKEKELLGTSLQYITYIECIDETTSGLTQACQDANITSFPTWQLPDGTKESGFKTLEQLAEVSGCSL